MTNIDYTDRATLVYLVTVGSKTLVRATQAFDNTIDILNKYIMNRVNDGADYTGKYDEVMDIRNGHDVDVTELATFAPGTPVYLIEQFASGMIAVHNSYYKGYNKDVFYRSSGLKGRKTVAEAA